MFGWIMECNCHFLLAWLKPWKISYLGDRVACLLGHLYDYMLQYPTCITLEEHRPLTHAHQWTRTTANVRLRFMTLCELFWTRIILYATLSFLWVSSHSIIKQLTSNFWVLRHILLWFSFEKNAKILVFFGMQ